MSKRNCKNNRNRKGHRMFISGIISLLLVIICSCFFGSFFSSAHAEHSPEATPKVKYYKSIEIQKGDSLWKIAEENISDEYQSIYEYMDELIRINNIDIVSADKIQEGNYLTIAYYE